MPKLFAVKKQIRCLLGHVNIFVHCELNGVAGVTSQSLGHT